MARQAHDLGRKKRIQALEASKAENKTPSAYQLAKDLVERGLASKVILEAPHSTMRRKRPAYT